MKKQSFSIHTRNQAGTTLYYLGMFNDCYEAFDFAVANYKWFAKSPNINDIVVSD